MADNNKPTGFSFGSPAAKPAGGFTFGGTGAPVQSTPAVPGAAPPAFNLSATPSAPAGGFSFGSAPTASTAAPSLSFGGGLGLTATAPASQPAAPAPSLSFGLGASKPAATTTATFSALPSLAAATSATSGFASFAPPTSAAPAATGFTGFSVPASTTSATQPAATKSVPTFGSLSTNPAPPTTTAAAAPALNLTGVTPASTAAATTNPLANLTTTTTTTQSATPAAQPAGSQLNFCQLEEYINKWTLELEEQEKMFTNQATQINAWDRVLIENSDKIVALNYAFEKVKTEQKALEHELEYIAAQHSELDECIKPLEKEMSKTQQFDPEREQTYLMAESLDTQLKQMGEDLKEVIEHLNEANKDRDPNDPIVQIGKILNAHMSSLQWIENSTSQITSRLEDITKSQETLRRDNERSFRLNI